MNANEQNVTARAGDVLLCMGKGELSKLIAWSADCDYSHAAVVVDDSHLVEAAIPVSRKVRLEDEKKKGKDYHYIDLWRAVSVLDAPLSPANAAALRKIGEFLVGRTYPTSLLPELGIAVAVRQKFPKDMRLRYVMRFAMDVAINWLIKHPEQTVMCSELTYLALADGHYEPPGLLTPVVDVQPHSGRPLPPIDLLALWKEIEHLIPHRLSKVLAEALELDVSAPPAAGAFEDGDFGDAASYQSIPTDESLARQAAHLALAANRSAANENGKVRIPNPKMMTPGDFAASRSFFRVGRFLQGQ